jgi:hypothetical protein
MSTERAARDVRGMDEKRKRKRNGTPKHAMYEESTEVTGLAIRSSGGVFRKCTAALIQL